MKNWSLAAAFLLSTALVRADVLVVSPISAPSPTLQAAIDAAVDGDVILVNTGIYSSILIRNKALTVVANTNADVKINGAIRVGDLPGTRTVVLSGLASLGGFAPSDPQMYGLHVSRCYGLVLAQDCVLTGSPPSSSSAVQGRSSLLVEESQSVVLSSCVITGGAVQPGVSFGYDGPAPDGAHTVNSSVSFFETTIQGTDANDDGDEGKGGDGLVATNSLIYTSGGSIRGGKGAFMVLRDGGPGGYGCRMSQGGGLTRIGTSFSGGIGGPNGGSPSWPPTFPGPAGIALWLDPGTTHAAWSGLARRFTAPALIRKGDTVHLTFNGAVSDRLARISSRAGLPVFLPDIGTHVPSHNTTYRVPTIGYIGPTGAFTQAVPILTLAQGEQARVLFFQGLHVELSGTSRVGTPRALIMLDSAF